jgi:hypothetical protein
MKLTFSLFMGVVSVVLFLTAIGLRVVYGWSDDQSRFWEIVQIALFAVYSWVFLSRHFRERNRKTEK